jgi:hypothetical protein
VKPDGAAQSAREGPLRTTEGQLAREGGTKLDIPEIAAQNRALRICPNNPPDLRCSPHCIAAQNLALPICPNNPDRGGHPPPETRLLRQ